MVLVILICVKSLRNKKTAGLSSPNPSSSEFSWCVFSMIEAGKFISLSVRGADREDNRLCPPTYQRYIGSTTLISFPLLFIDRVWQLYETAVLPLRVTMPASLPPTRPPTSLHFRRTRDFNMYARSTYLLADSSTCQRRKPKVSRLRHSHRPRIWPELRPRIAERPAAPHTARRSSATSARRPPTQMQPMRRRSRRGLEQRLPAVTENFSPWP